PTAGVMDPRFRGDDASAFLQKYVVRRVGRAVQGAGLVAGAGEHAARGVDALHGGDARERAAAALRRHLELEPGNVVGGLARRVAGGLRGDRAAVHVLPARPGIVAADGLAV